MFSFIVDLPSQFREVYDRGRLAWRWRSRASTHTEVIARPIKRRPIPKGETESVCWLFSCCRSAELFEYLAARSESPLQVPFYYLELVQAGSVSGEVADTVEPTAAHVELAYRAILQRFPENRAVVQHHIEVHKTVDDLISALLSSEEATSAMPILHARAFPSAKRLWHVHIPKTAGTSFFGAAARSGWGYVNTNAVSGAVGDLQQVASAVCNPGQSEKVIISGHWHLSKYAASIGPFDRVVVFVRDPVDRMTSEFNYAVDVINQNSNVHSGDPEEFLARGLDPESFAKSYRNGFFGANAQCGFLSRPATCAAAMQALTSCGGELLPSVALDATASKTFSHVARKANVSTKHVNSQDIERGLREEIILNNPHDFALHEIAKARYHKSES